MLNDEIPMTVYDKDIKSLLHITKVLKWKLLPVIITSGSTLSPVPFADCACCDWSPSIDGGGGSK